MMTILLILFVLDGNPHMLTVQTNGPEVCALMVEQVPEILPKLIGKPPQFYAAACAEVKPFLTGI